MDQLKAIWKWLLSWRKRDWDASDYPLRYREQIPSAEFESVYGTPPRWSLQVVNWWQMFGVGNTRAEAYTNFETRLADLRETGASLPRPGRGLPLEFTSSSVVERHEDLARDLFSQILDINYDECFISDQSSLYDFVFNESQASELADRIESLYQIELPDRQTLLVSEILEVIAAKRGTA